VIIPNQLPKYDIHTEPLEMNRVFSSSGYCVSQLPVTIMKYLTQVTCEGKRDGFGLQFWSFKFKIRWHLGLSCGDEGDAANNRSTC
jgi:hypothetical protein